jgi:hypothetical protein
MGQTRTEYNILMENLLGNGILERDVIILVGLTLK